MGIFDVFKKKDFPPKPKWKPSHPVDIDLVMETAKYYTGAKRQLAVFKYGTVITFTEKVDDITKQAMSILNIIYNSHPDFNPQLMDDQNYTVQYSEPAFTIVFKDEVDNYWNYIDKNHQDGVCRDEVLMGKEGQNTFDKIGKIGLYGRSKMFMDAQDPNVVLTYDI